MKRLVDLTLHHARRVVIAVIGGTLLLLGVLGIIIPVVPGFWLLPIGLAVLATEFVWARRLLRNVKERARSLMGGTSADPRAPEPSKRNAGAP